jgi:hypothetical protein
MGTHFVNKAQTGWKTWFQLPSIPPYNNFLSRVGGFMRTFHWIVSAAFAALFCLASHAQTPSVAHLKAEPAVAAAESFDPKVQIAGRTLALNGAGVRYRAVFKVYQAALYLEKPTQNFGEISKATGEAKRIQLVMQRTVVADELGKLFVRGIQENLDKHNASRLISPMVRMSELFSEYKSLEAGDEILLDWIPGTGTVVTVKGKRAAAAIPEPEFFNALAGIWLGATPADWKLRDAMLGVRTTAVASPTTMH